MVNGQEWAALVQTSKNIDRVTKITIDIGITHTAKKVTLTKPSFSMVLNRKSCSTVSKAFSKSTCSSTPSSSEFLLKYSKVRHINIELSQVLLPA